MKLWTMFTGWRELTLLIHLKVWDTEWNDQQYAEYRFHALVWEIALLVPKR